MQIKSDSLDMLDAAGTSRLLKMDTTKQVQAQFVLTAELFTYDTAASVIAKKIGFPITPELDGMLVKDVYLFCHDKGVTGAMEIQVVRRRAGADVNVLSTTVSMGDEYYATDGVVNASYDDLATGDMLFVSVTAIHSGTAANGSWVGIIVGPADPA
jgi:hypothetical protein